MIDMKYADHLTNEQLGKAFRGALTVNQIADQISSSEPSVKDLLRSAEHEAEKLYPEQVAAINRRTEFVRFSSAIDRVEETLALVFQYLRGEALSDVRDGVHDSAEATLNALVSVPAGGGASGRVSLSRAEHVVQEHANFSYGEAINMACAIFDTIITDVDEF